jgi:hypothetical protein
LRELHIRELKQTTFLYMLQDIMAYNFRMLRSQGHYREGF